MLLVLQQNSSPSFQTIKTKADLLLAHTGCGDWLHGGEKEIEEWQAENNEEESCVQQSLSWWDDQEPREILGQKGCSRGCEIVVRREGSLSQMKFKSRL